MDEPDPYNLVERCEQTSREFVTRRGDDGGVVYFAGELPPQRHTRVGVVGARRARPHQLEVTAEIVSGLCTAGATVVSGGAIGVDATAHRSALDCQGVTIAVLPSGLGRPWPAKHDSLFGKIVARGGTVLSPFDLRAPATRPRFHKRNLLICQMIDALIVVCGEVRSGSLHCARRAWRMGLPVLAVPWTPGSPNSEGSNGILASGGPAVWSSHGANLLVQTLQAGACPGARPHALRASSSRDRQRKSLPSNEKTTEAIDERVRPRQRCAGHGGPTQPLLATDGCDAVAVAAIEQMSRQSEDGTLSLEELVAMTSLPRTQLAKTLLELMLMGQLRRTTGGRYRR